MEVKTRAIVLQTIKYGDAQLIVDFFTEKLGRVSFMVKIPKSSKAKMKRQLFQPLMILNLEFDHRPKANLQRLKDVSIALPFVDLPFSPYKLAMSMFLAELLGQATRNEQVNVPLFSFIEESVAWLDQHGDFFDLEEGRFVSFVPTHVHYLNKEDSLRMLGLLRLSYETMHLYTMSRLDRNRCVEVILQYYRIHVPGFPELKSFSVLQELFA